MDRIAPNLSSLFAPGQSLVAKVVEVDEEKKRFLLNLRMRDTFQGDTETGLDLLERYLDERKAILEKLELRKGLFS